MRKKNERLTQQQFYRLCDALKGMAAQFAAEHTSVGVAAQQLTNALGFTVSPTQVRSACQATGVAWDAKHARRKTNAPSGALEALARQISSIADSLGVTVSPEVRNLAQRKPWDAHLRDEKPKGLADEGKALNNVVKPLLKPEIVPVRVAGK